MLPYLGGLFTYTIMYEESIDDVQNHPQWTAFI